LRMAKCLAKTVGKGAGLHSRQWASFVTALLPRMAAAAVVWKLLQPLAQERRGRAAVLPLSLRAQVVALTLPNSLFLEVTLAVGSFQPRRGGCVPTLCPVWLESISRYALFRQHYLQC